MIKSAIVGVSLSVRHQFFLNFFISFKNFFKNIQANQF